MPARRRRQDTIVGWLCATEPITAVIRFNGGAQAAHNVVTPGPIGRHHTFAQFGSGTCMGCPPTCQEKLTHRLFAAC